MIEQHRSTCSLLRDHDDVCRACVMVSANRGSSMGTLSKTGYDGMKAMKTMSRGTQYLLHTG